MAPGAFHCPIATPPWDVRNHNLSNKQMFRCWVNFGAFGRAVFPAMASVGAATFCQNYPSLRCCYVPCAGASGEAPGGRPVDSPRRRRWAAFLCLACASDKFAVWSQPSPPEPLRIRCAQPISPVASRFGRHRPTVRGAQPAASASRS
jgi:hypothetical protein